MSFLFSWVLYCLSWYEWYMCPCCEYIFFPCSVKCPINVIYVRLINNVLAVFCILLADFLSSYSTSYWLKNIEVAKYNCGMVYFSFNSISFCLIRFEVLLLAAYTFMIIISLFSVLLDTVADLLTPVPNNFQPIDEDLSNNVKRFCCFCFDPLSFPDLPSLVGF